VLEGSYKAGLFVCLFVCLHLPFTRFRLSCFSDFLVVSVGTYRTVLFSRDHIFFLVCNQLRFVRPNPNIKRPNKLSLLVVPLPSQLDPIHTLIFLEVSVPALIVVRPKE
jgi:hypothetical protein